METRSSRPQAIDIALKVLPILNILTTVCLIVRSNEEFDWQEVVALLGLAVFYAITSYYEVNKFGLRSAVQNMPIVQRLWLDESAHAALMALIFAFLKVSSVIYSITQLILSFSAAIYGLKRNLLTPEQFGWLKRIASVLEIITFPWLLVVGIFTGNGSVLLASLAYALVVVLFGVSCVREHGWVYGQVDSFAGNNVKGPWGKIRGFFVKVGDVAGVIYPRSLFDKVTH